MNIWAWIEDYSAEALRERNVDKIRLVNLCWEALPLTTQQPERALELLGEGERLAAQLQERRWALFFQHWTVQTLIFRTREYTQALQIAEPAAAESRRPEFVEFPQRVCLHDDLINIYLGRDPAGYAPAITDAFGYMEAEVADTSQCRLCLQSLRVDHAVALKDWDAASEEAIRLMNMAHRYPHYAAYGYALLCRIAYGRRDRSGLARWAWMADDTASATAEEGSAVELWMWQALASRWAGQEAKGFTAYRKARAAARRQQALPTSGYYDACAEYHQTLGAFRRALRVRRRELTALEGKGQTFEELQCRLKIIRLMAALRRSAGTEIAHAEALAKTLADPQPFLSELAALSGAAPPLLSDG